MEFFDSSRDGSRSRAPRSAAGGRFIVVEGPNDVIRLDTLGTPAVGLCSNIATAEQIVKIARFAKTVAGNRVTLMLDLDAAGEAGTQHALFELARVGMNVRLGWSAEMLDGKFEGRQPEGLTEREWAELARGGVGEVACLLMCLQGDLQR